MAFKKLTGILEQKIEGVGPLFSMSSSHPNTFDIWSEPLGQRYISFNNFVWNIQKNNNFDVFARRSDQYGELILGDKWGTILATAPRPGGGKWVQWEYKSNRLFALYELVDTISDPPFTYKQYRMYELNPNTLAIISQSVNFIEAKNFIYNGGDIWLSASENVYVKSQKIYKLNTNLGVIQTTNLNAPINQKTWVIFSEDNNYIWGFHEPDLIHSYLFRIIKSTGALIILTESVNLPYYGISNNTSFYISKDSNKILKYDMNLNLQSVWDLGGVFNEFWSIRGLSFTSTYILVLLNSSMENNKKRFIKINMTGDIIFESQIVNGMWNNSNFFLNFINHIRYL
jgi:hypothetical protein